MGHFLELLSLWQRALLVLPLLEAGLVVSPVTTEAPLATFFFFVLQHKESERRVPNSFLDSAHGSMVSQQARELDGFETGSFTYF